MLIEATKKLRLIAACCLLLAGVFLPTSAGWAQDGEGALTSEQIQAQTRRIQADIAAARNLAAKREEIAQAMDDVREHLVVIDACLNAARGGSLIFVTAIGTCQPQTVEELRDSLMIKVLMGELQPEQAAQTMANAAQASISSFQTLRIAQRTLQGKLEELRLRSINASAPAAAPPQQAACNLAGVYHNQVEGLGESQWTISPDGAARESGLGGGSGRATMNGHMLTIEWTTPSGYAGNYKLMFDASCTLASGLTTQTKAPPGAAPGKYRVRFVPNAYAPPPPTRPLPAPPPAQAQASGSSQQGGCMIRSSNSCAYTTPEGCAFFKGQFCGPSSSNPCHPVNGVNSC